MDEKEQHADELRQSLESIIGGSTKLRRKRKTELDINQEMFEKMIRTLEEIQVRSALLHTDLGLDYSTYDEKFYEAIDLLVVMCFGAEAAELIFYYIYERIVTEEQKDELVDEKTGQVVPLNNVSDLWVLVNEIRNKGSKVKK